MMNFDRRYEKRSSYPKPCAQENLSGRTHYVDDDSLRFHDSRILWARPLCDGLLFAIIESVATEYRGSKRGFRYVVFDLFGNVVSRVSLEECERTSAAAHRKLDKWLTTANPTAINLEALERAERQFSNSAAELRSKLFQQAA